MLVTFHSDAWSDITMFGDVAVTLLKMAGHSGTVPSAILARDIPSALARLQQELAAVGPEPENNPGARPESEDTDSPPPPGLRLRAHPLIELLSAAARQGCDVTWDAGGRLV